MEAALEAARQAHAEALQRQTDASQAAAAAAAFAEQLKRQADGARRRASELKQEREQSAALREAERSTCAEKLAEQRSQYAADMAAAMQDAAASATRRRSCKRARRCSASAWVSCRGGCRPRRTS